MKNNLWSLAVLFLGMVGFEVSSVVLADGAGAWDSQAVHDQLLSQRATTQGGGHGAGSDAQAAFSFEE